MVHAYLPSPWVICKGTNFRRLISTVKSSSLIFGRRGASRASKKCRVIRKLLDRYGSQGFVVVGLKFDTMMDMENPLKFAKKIGVRYPLAVATDDLRRKFGGIEGLPTTMLYDRDGILRQKVIGFEYTETFEANLKPLL